MKKRTTFSTILQTILPLLVGGILWSSCGGESQPAAETKPADTTQTTPAATEPPGGLKFNFEHFGNFDLSTWQAMPPKTEEGGDVEIEVAVYGKDGATMEIEEANMGEYGYQLWHRLKGSDGKVQKTRSLAFTNDPYAVTETVNDYTVMPAKKYIRTQTLDKHYTQLDSLPMQASGEWKEAAADEL